VPGAPALKPRARDRHLSDVSAVGCLETTLPDGGPIPAIEDDRRRAPDPLVSRAQQGDVAAFEELYRAHVGRVFALCVRLCGDPSQAEELAQEAFIRAWRKLGSFRGDSAFGSWLYALTVNTALSERRSRRRRDARVVATDDLDAFDRPGPPRRPDQRMDLERALATLPPGARAVLVLHDVEGYKHDEIAQMTGIATGTSKAQLHRARRLLREVLTR
jgi:RNA polymerase sigma-70 factor (ECF subfamily)